MLEKIQTNLITALTDVSNIGGSYPPNPLLRTEKHQEKITVIKQTKKLTKTCNQFTTQRSFEF